MAISPHTLVVDDEIAIRDMVGLVLQQAGMNCDLVAYYNRRHTIYFPASLDINVPADQARLMHELVHYVQWANQRNKDTCLGHLEVEAYDIQDKWRARFGLGESIDPFRKILLAASCDD